jgi:hypothetical protein
VASGVADIGMYVIGELPVEDLGIDRTKILE